MATNRKSEPTSMATAAPSSTMSNWTVDDIRKSDILTFRESRTEYVDTVVCPNGLQVGLLDEAFVNDLLVVGNITGSGVIYASTAFSGSLQTLIDGSDYLRGANGITVTNHEEGYIVISGGGATQGTTYSAGAGLNLGPNNVFTALPDLSTIGFNSSNQLEVISMPHTLTVGNGLIGNNFNGAASSTLAVNAVSGSPITVTSSGIDFSTANVSAVSVASNDHVLVSSNGGIAKVQVQDLINLGIGNTNLIPQDAQYLVMQSHSGLANEKVFAANNGLQLTTTNSGVTVSAVVKNNGGLEIISGELAVKIGDFVGVGLTANSGTGRIDLNLGNIAGTGLTQNGSVINTDFGTSANQVAMGSNTIGINAGKGLIHGNPVAIGNATSMINLAVDANDIAGVGTQITNGNLGVNLTGQNGITISSGANNSLLIGFSNPDGFGTGSGNGSVTSVGITPGNLIDVSGSPITSSGNIQVDVDLNELPTSTTNADGAYFVSVDGSGVQNKIAKGSVNISGFNNDAGYLSGVTAGTGLVDGGTNNNVKRVDIDYLGDDSVIKSATDGTSITIDAENDLLLLQDHSDNGTVKYIKPSQLGGTSSGGTIGPAPDSDYSDGLFSDFTSSTSIGTAIDKINEVLKLLGPSPAPDVADISVTTSMGINAKLSFGASNSGGSTYVDSANTAGLTPVDTNGTYSLDTSGANKRLGIFLTSANIEGIINDSTLIGDYANGTVNYVANSFGNGDLGVLKLFVNDNTTPKWTVDLSSFTGVGNPGTNQTSDSLNGNGSGFFHLSLAKNATSEGGKQFAIYKHRTGKYRIHPNDQVEGWNYARVVHTVSGENKETNYIEWVNDTDTTAITATNVSISSFTGSDEFYMSGIKYFKTASFGYAATVNDAHRGLHTSTPLVFNSTYGSISTATDQNNTNLINVFPSVESGETFAKTIQITANGSFSVTSNNFPALGLINGSNTVSFDIVHPNEDKNESALGSTNLTGLLMWYPTTAATSLSEDFLGESYRMQTGNYNTQASVYANSAYVTPWNKEIKVNSSDAGHNTGLVLYQGELRAPANTFNGGNFTSITNGPTNNANYSSGITGTRNYIRAFQKLDAGIARDMRISMRGNGTLVANNVSLGTNNNNFRCFVKVPGITTGWMDLALAFSVGNTGDNDEAYVTSLSSTISDTVTHNYASIGTLNISQNDYVLIKIEADPTWTGNLDLLELRFPASGGNATATPLQLGTINSTTVDGVEAKLSFGSTQSIPNSDTGTNSTVYTNVAGANSLTSADINALYAPDGNGPKKGVYNGGQTIDGIVNSNNTSVNIASGSDTISVNNVIRYADEGTIKLIVNDVVLHSLDLTNSSVGAGVPGSGTATSFETSGQSGFTNISAAVNPVWSENQIPDFRYKVRTLNYRVHANHQRNGHNYVKIQHEIVGGSTYDTTYIEWVNDSDNNDVTITNATLNDFTDSNIAHLSGIKYFQSPSTTFSYRANHVYRNVYSASSTALGFSGGSDMVQVDLTSVAITGTGVQDPSNSTSDATQMPNLLTNSATNYTGYVDVTGTFDYVPTKVLPGTHGTGDTPISIKTKALHPLSNAANNTASTLTKANFLVYSPSQSSPSNEHAIENFSAESYRLKDEAFPISSATTATVDAATWDSTESLVGNGSGSNAGHNTGLCVYNEKIIAPRAAGNNGDFTTGLQGPANNVDYSTANTASTRRTYLRKFYKNSIGDAATSITLRMTGKGSLKSENGPTNQGTLGNNDNFYIKVKYVFHSTQNPTTFNTGWLDAGENINYVASDGSPVSLQNDTLTDLNVQWNNSTNSVVIGMPSNRYLSGTDATEHSYVIIKIEASEQWTGYFSDMRITSFS